MSEELVTAVVPAYGRPIETQRAINSVACQTHSPIELIVIDDGSEPPLKDAITLPREQIADAKLVQHNENQGGNVARNTGIEHARGEYIAFLDSDDEWKPTKTERQLTALKRSGRAAYTSVEQIDSDGRRNTIRRAVHGGNLRSRLLTGNEIGTFSSVMVDSDVFTNVGKPDPNLPCWQDWEWYLRLSQSIQFVAVDELLVRRHNEEGQISRKFEPKWESAYPVLQARLLKTARTPEEEESALAHLDYHLGYAALVNGQFSTARSQFLKAIRRQPMNLAFYKYLAVTGRHYSIARQLKRRVVRAT